MRAGASGGKEFRARKNPWTIPADDREESNSPRRADAQQPDPSSQQPHREKHDSEDAN